MKKALFIIFLHFLVTQVGASDERKVLFQDKYVFKISNEIFSLNNLENYFEELHNLKCYYPDSLLVRVFSDEMNSKHRNDFKMVEEFSDKQKAYFVRLINFGKLLVYSRSHNVKVNSALEKYFHSITIKNKCSKSSFNGSKFNPTAKELVRLEVFVRSRFLPVEKSGKVTKTDYLKAVTSTKALILSINRQIDEEVYW